MNEEEALQLISELGGDEHRWVDFKEDYDVGGTKYHKAEFVKDIASLANSITGRDTHYIFVGCTEGDGVVGMNYTEIGNEETEESEADELEDEEGDSPRHLMSYDESDIQETINQYLSPTPNFTLHTFDTDDGELAVLEIRPSANVPSVVENRIHDDANTYLHAGRIWIRGGSGKKVALREDIEDIIQFRIQAQREFLTDGLRRVVDLGPEFLMDIATLGPEEEADFTISPDEEGDLSVSSVLAHPIEFSGPQEEIYSDVSKWRQRDSYTSDLESLYYYYSNETEFEKDEDVIAFLFQSSLSHWIPGIFWLREIEDNQILSLISDVPDQHPSRRVACKILLLMGEDEFLNDFIGESDSIHRDGRSISKYRRLAGIHPRYDSETSVSQRWEEILSVISEVDFDDLQLSGPMSEFQEEDAIELIPQIATRLMDLESRTDLTGEEENIRNDLKYWLVNMEIILGRHILLSD